MCLEDKNVSLDQIFATIDSVYATHPEIVPVTKEQTSETVASTPQQAKTTDTSFNLTKPIQQHLDTLRPTTALTEYTKVVLSEEEIKSLKPVSDRTLTQLLVLFAGKGARPYMLDGSLLAHTADDAYIKILPDINKDGYASYKFVAVDYKTLNFVIDKFIRLLVSTEKYAELLDYDDIEPENMVFDETDLEMVFGNKPIPKPKSTIEDDNFIDRDVETLSILKEMLKARKQSTFKHLEMRTLSDKLDSQARLYAEDKELLGYLRAVVNCVYKDLEKPYKSPYVPYIDTFYISGHHLSTWVYYREDYRLISEPQYDSQGNRLYYEPDHLDKDPSNNRPENLEIKLKQDNLDARSTSRPVTYNGQPYPTTQKYCDAFGLSYDYLNARLSKLQPSETYEYKDKTYSLNTDGRSYIAVDSQSKAPVYSYNGISYATLSDFAVAVGLNYKSLNNSLSNARKDNKIKFKFKNKYTFYLNNGNITKIL